MHELSLARTLVRQVEELAAQHGAAGVSIVRVSVGEFSGVEAELLESAVRTCSAGTLLEAAEINVLRVPLEVRCSVCSAEFHVCGFRFRCPDCGATDVQVLRGEELMLESVTLKECET